MSTPAQSLDPQSAQPLIHWLEEPAARQIPRVGGKNAGLAEMIQTLGAQGIRVPPGFATSASAYRQFIAANALAAPLRALLEAHTTGKATLADTGAAIRRHIVDAALPAPFEQAIRSAYRELSVRCGVPEATVAVRSSATAEDLPQASFAGQQETFLNVHGESALLRACRDCYASLFTDRAIVYRETNGFDHLQVALSIGIQQMVRSDLAGSGVMFSLDTETGFPGVVVINAAWGLGENVVQGIVTPDKYLVLKALLADTRYCPIIEKSLGSKEQKLLYGEGGGARTRNVPTTRRERESFVLSDAEILQLARWAVAIEAHHGRPMDIEWAKDGQTGVLYLVQARPETVQSSRSATAQKTYRLDQKGARLLTGAAIGDPTNEVFLPYFRR